MDGVIDVFLSLGRVGREKTLMDREAARIHPVTEALPLQAREIIVGFVGHLLVQDLHGIESHLGGEVDASFDASEVVISELPKGIGGNGDAIGTMTGAFRGFGARLFVLSRSRGGSTCQTNRGCRPGQKSAAVQSTKLGSN